MKKVKEKVKMSLQIAATADFNLWIPVCSRVSIGLAEKREVSKESTEVDNEQLQTYLLRAVTSEPTASMYLQLNSLLFEFTGTKFYLKKSPTRVFLGLS